MIVCVCRNVSDRTIRAAIEAGATTVHQVAAATAAGTSCGCCRAAIESMIVAARSGRSGAPSAGCPSRSDDGGREAA